MATDDIFEKLEEITFAITCNTDNVRMLNQGQADAQNNFALLAETVKRAAEDGQLEDAGLLCEAISVLVALMEKDEDSKLNIAIANQKQNILLSIQDRLAAQVAKQSVGTEFSWASEQIAAPATKTTTPTQSPPISQLWAEYTKEQEAHWQPGTCAENKEAFRAFIEIVTDLGADKLSIEVTRNYKKSILDYPLRRNVGQNAAKSLDELRQQNGKRIAASTASNRMTLITAFLSWAQRHGYIDNNFLAPLVTKREKDRKNRDSFTPEDLRLIFADPRFQNGSYKNDWEFWLPLLALYTGCRLGELCQLRGKNVASANGTSYIDICESGVDMLKTKNSTRKIPLHPHVVELGFVEFAAARGSDYLFNVNPVNGKRSHYPSRQFGTFKKNLGLGTKKTFHSFRHTFRDSLSDADVRDSIVVALMGHSDESITFKTYGSDAKLNQLSQAIGQLDFRDILRGVAPRKT
nr:site-specific integrase [Marortus sp. BJYM1]